MTEIDETDMAEYKKWKETKHRIGTIVMKSENEVREATADDTKPAKPKRVQSEKQKANFLKMREAQMRKIEERKLSGEKQVFKPTKEHLQRQEKAHEEADKIRELVPDAKVIVKDKKGRPRGKVMTVGPTPMVSDDDEDEEDEVKVNTIRQPSQPRPPVNDIRKKPTRGVSAKFDFVDPDSVLNKYLRSLNGM